MLAFQERALVVVLAGALDMSFAVWNEIDDVASLAHYTRVGGGLAVDPTGLATANNASLAAMSEGALVEQAAAAASSERHNLCDKSNAVDARMLICVGVQKGGTTDLHARLLKAKVDGHDAFIDGGTKEHHFFDSSNKADEGARQSYMSSFVGNKVKVQNHQHSRCRPIGLDMTPSYICAPEASRRICETIHEPKILVILRSPAARALSGFKECGNRKGCDVSTDTKSFKDGDWQSVFQSQVSSEIERIGALPWDQIVQSRAEVIALHHQAEPKLQSTSLGDWERFQLESVNAAQRQIVARGLYKGQLEELFRHHRKENVMILQSELFFEDPAKYTAKVAKFAGLRGCNANLFPAPNSDDGINSVVHGDDLDNQNVVKALGALKSFFGPRNDKLAKYLATEADPSLTFFDLSLWQQ